MNESINRTQEMTETGRSGVVWLSAIAAFGAFAVAQGYSTDALYGEDKAVELVENIGLTNVSVEDTNRFGVGYGICGPLDSVEYVVVGENPQGNTVNLSVCKGLFTGPSIHGGM